MLNTFKLPKLILPLVFSGGLIGAGCSASVGDPAPSNSSGQPASNRMGNSVTDTSIPINQRFRTLDDYLVFLQETQGPVDGPWYKEVSPGMYQLQTGNLHLDVPGGTNGKQLFTRRELEQKFGFAK